MFAPDLIQSLSRAGSSTDNMFTIGSVCIDKRGFHWKAPDSQGEARQAAHTSRDSSGGLPWAVSAGTDSSDELRRGSRKYLEAKRGLREVY